MTSGPIASWQIDGETMETVTDFIFLGSKMTADGDFSHEIKRRLVLGRKAMIFPVVTYECESWTIRRLSTEELMIFNYGIGEDS